MKKINRQIVTHFCDDDLYTFSVMYYVLINYPRAEIEYNFFDRNNTVYPEGFAEELIKQMDGMRNVVITDEEINYMEKRMYWFPKWFLNTYLRGFRYDPSELDIKQDEEGHLHIKIKGPWAKVIKWEMPLLSTISEMYHEEKGDLDLWNEKGNKTLFNEKAMLLLENGVRFSEMSTRRRISFAFQEEMIQIVSALNKLVHNNKFYEKIQDKGEFIGTSNVYFAMKYNLTPIGTISHQAIQFEEIASGMFEANHNVMVKWQKTFSDLGIALPDTFTNKMFLNNFSKQLAKLFDGIRIDSGSEEKALEDFINRYESLGIDPKTKTIVFSNGLDGKRAVELHKFVNGRMKDSYGIGTWLGGKTDDISNMNIVIKATKGRITESREWSSLCKLSNDISKATGDERKKKILIDMLETVE